MHSVVRVCPSHRCVRAHPTPDERSCVLHVASVAGAVGFALATSEHASRLDSIVLVAPLPSGGLADVGFEAADSVVEAMVSRRAQPADGAREVARSHYEGALFSMAQFDKTAELGERTVAVLHCGCSAHSWCTRAWCVQAMLRVLCFSLPAVPTHSCTRTCEITASCRMPRCMCSQRRPTRTCRCPRYPLPS